MYMYLFISKVGKTRFQKTRQFIFDANIGKTRFQKSGQGGARRGREAGCVELAP